MSKYNFRTTCHRTQFPIKLFVTSTIHKIMCETSPKDATQIVGFHYIRLVIGEHLKSYAKTKSKDIAIQSWYCMLSNSELTECYASYENVFKLEPHLFLLLPCTQIKLARFRCALYALPTVNARLNNTDCDLYPLCECACCTPDEYHFVMKCVTLDTVRMKCPMFSYKT